MSVVEIRRNRFGDSYDVVRHPTGLTIYVYPKEGWHTAYGVIGTGFGSVDVQFQREGEPAESVPAGTAHYLEHKLFESEDQDAFARFAALGASANAYTSYDSTCYLFSGSEHIYESLEVLLDFVQSPYFTPENVQKERGIIAQEIGGYRDAPQWQVTTGLLEALYHRHPVTQDIAGTVESIAQITPECLYRCYDTFYRPNRMTLALAGKVETQAVLDVCDRVLRPASPVNVRRLLPEEPREIVRPLVRRSMSVGMPLFQLGFKCDGTMPRDERMTAAAEVLLELMASDASPLFRRLTDAGLISETSFDYESFDGPGFAMALFSGESARPEEACEMILDEVRRLRREGVDPQAFERARRCLYGGYISAFNSAESIAGNLLQFSLRGFELFHYSDVLAALTPDDVNDCLMNILDPAYHAVSIIDPLPESKEDNL